MKHFLTVLIILCSINCCFGAPSKKITPSLTEEQITIMNNKIDNIYKKIYGGSFLSPSDSSDLIGIKIKLDDAMLVSPDTKYAVIYYKLGNIYKIRGNKSEAIDCYKSIVENFSDTALAPKAAVQLNKLGINVIVPKKQQIEEEED